MKNHSKRKPLSTAVSLEHIRKRFCPSLGGLMRELDGSSEFWCILRLPEWLWWRNKATRLMRNDAPQTTDFWSAVLWIHAEDQDRFREAVEEASKIGEVRVQCRVNSKTVKAIDAVMQYVRCEHAGKECPEDCAYVVMKIVLVDGGRVTGLAIH